MWRNLDRSGGYHGSRPVAAVAATPVVRTLKQVAQLWLAQHPSNGDKPATVEGYAGMMEVGIWPELTWTDARTGRTRRIELGTMAIGDIRPTDINQWITALAAKPDTRRKGPRGSASGMANEGGKGE